MLYTMQSLFYPEGESGSTMRYKILLRGMQRGE